MNAAAELIARHPAPAARHLQQQRMAYLAAASAAMEVMMGQGGPSFCSARNIGNPLQSSQNQPPPQQFEIPTRPKHTQVVKAGSSKQHRSSLGLAARMVAASRKTAARIAELEAASAAGPGGAADGVSAVGGDDDSATKGAAEDADGVKGAGANKGGDSAAKGANSAPKDKGSPADVFTALQEFAIAARRRDGAELAAALARAAALPCVRAEHLLRMAAVVGDPEFRWVEVVSLSVSACLWCWGPCVFVSAGRI
jgi:hypothetical protein